MDDRENQPANGEGVRPHVPVNPLDYFSHLRTIQIDLSRKAPSCQMENGEQLSTAYILLRGDKVQQHLPNYMIHVPLDEMGIRPLAGFFYGEDYTFVTPIKDRGFWEQLRKIEECFHSVPVPQPREKNGKATRGRSISSARDIFAQVSMWTPTELVMPDLCRDFQYVRSYN
jgi:hypothetical protein